MIRLTNHKFWHFFGLALDGEPVVGVTQK